MVDIKLKEKEVTDILEEMKSDKLKELGFSDLLVEMSYEVPDNIALERYGSQDGWKTVITDVIERTKIDRDRIRLNNINLGNTHVKDNMLFITYEENKKISIRLDYITRFFIMKQNDEKIY